MAGADSQRVVRGLRSTIWLTNDPARLTLNQMVELAPTKLDAVFHALADPTRRAMLRRLAGEPLSVGALAAPHAMSLAAASKHIKALERAGLVRRQVKGRTHLCSLAPGPLGDAHDWLGFYRRLWSESFDALGALIRAQDAAEAEGDPP